MKVWSYHGLQACYAAPRPCFLPPRARAWAHPTACDHTERSIRCLCALWLCGCFGGFLGLWSIHSRSAQFTAVTSQPLHEKSMKKKKDPAEARTPSLVQQLHALALLNREEAQRRLNATGLPTDMLLAHDPPSLLVSTASLGGSSSGFPRRPVTSGPMYGSVTLTARTIHGTPARREFQSAHQRKNLWAGGVAQSTTPTEVAATRAISAAREDVIRASRPSFTTPAAASMRWHPSSPSRQPLSLQRAAQACPVLETTLPSPAAVAAARAEEVRRQMEARAAAGEPLGRTTARALLGLPGAGSNNRRSHGPAAVGVGAVDAGAGAGRQHPSGYVPLPPRTHDPWAASEAQLAEQTRKKQLAKEMADVRAATALG